MTLRTLNYGNYGIFLIMGNAGFCPSTVSMVSNQKTSDDRLSFWDETQDPILASGAYLKRV